MFVNSLSNGEDYITSEQLERHMRSINKEGKPPKTPEEQQDELLNGELVNNYEETSSESEEEKDWTNRPDHNNEKLTEDHLVAAAVNYSHGQLPIVNQILCLNDPNLRALDHIPVFQRPILHPLLALKILYYRIIKYLGRLNLFSFLPFAKTDSQFLFLLLLYVFFSSDNFLLFLPMVVYYVTFVVMIITTFQMLQAKRDYQDFRVWSGLFITYSGGSLNAQEAEFQFIRNNLRPYGHFFLALLLNLMVYPLIAEQWIPQSELTVIAFVLTFMTLFGFLPKKRSKMLPHTLVLFSFAVNVIAKYPYETDPVVTQGWRFLDLKVPTFTGYIIGNGVELCINFKVLFYFFIPFLLLQMASKENWRGTYKILIPHCVTLSWLQIVIICSQGATMFGLLRATLALVGIVMFLPMVGLTSVILPAAALTKWLATNFTYSLLLFLGFLLAGLFICWLVARGRYKRYTTFIQIIFAIAAFLIVFNMDPKVKTEYEQQDDSKPLSWEVYQKYCYQPSWEDKNMALVQHKCLDLDGVRVSWDGHINSVKIRSLDNKMKQIFDKLPQTLADHLYCIYGEEIGCEDMHNEDCLSFFDNVKTRRKCSLAKYNTYTFEVNVRMKWEIWGKAAESILIVEDFFKNFTFALRPSDHVWFKGNLINENCPQGDFKPHIVIDEIGCLDCHNTEITQVKLNVKEEVTIEDTAVFLFNGVRSVLNFLFNPIVTFK